MDDVFLTRQSTSGGGSGNRARHVNERVLFERLWRGTFRALHGVDRPRNLTSANASTANNSSIPAVTTGPSSSECHCCCRCRDVAHSSSLPVAHMPVPVLAPLPPPPPIGNLQICVLKPRYSRQTLRSVVR